MAQAEHFGPDVILLDLGLPDMDGQQVLTSLTLAPEVVKSADVEMLQDLVLTAVNEATRKVEAAVQEKVGALTGGLKLPGM